MASAFELRGEELVEAGCCGAFINEAPREDDDVGVVVLTDEMGYLGQPH